MNDLVMTSESQLRAAGLRITPQRQLVLQILARSGRHLDANGIYERGRRRHARLSLSTVYRTLSVLKDTGVVRELHLDGEQHHYELDAKGEHFHLVCLDCGKVIEMSSTAFSEAADAAASAHGFEIASAQVELTGYCTDCRKKRETEASNLA